MCYSEYVCIHSDQLSFLVFEDSIGNAVFVAEFSSFFDEGFIFEKSFVGNGDGHSSEGVFLHFFNGKQSLRVWLLVGGISAFEFEEEVVDFGTK